jgi:hypothetical protein
MERQKREKAEMVVVCLFSSRVVSSCSLTPALTLSPTLNLTLTLILILTQP